MKLLLTSAGVRNASIRRALVDLLGKPIEESSALCIPTASYGHPHVGPGERAWQFVSGRSEGPMTELGWRSVGLLELTALPSIHTEAWVPLVRGTDVLLVGGGDALYLGHWLRESGLADLLPELTDTVWVGLSAGSMVLTPGSGRTSSAGRHRRAATRPSASWTSTSVRTSTVRTGRATPTRTPRSGPPASTGRPTPSTTRPPSRWSMEPSR